MDPQPPSQQEAVSPPPNSGRTEDDWLRLARQAREAGRLADARILLEEALQRFPDSTSLLHDVARAAEAMQDWPAAERHWRAFIAMATHLWWAFTSLADALHRQGRRQDADAVLTAQFANFPAEPWIFFEYARLAEKAGDWPEAAKRWASATARFPLEWDGYAGQSRAFRECGDLSAARRLLTDAAARFPDRAQPFHDIARLAEADQDWMAAEQAWRQFLARDEGEWWAHTGLSHALRRLRRFDEADTVLRGQLSRLAHEPGVFFEYAAIAEDRGDWAQAAERYRALLLRYPNHPHAALGLTYMLARLGRRTEGDDILRQAIATNPKDLTLRLAFARNAAEIGVEGAPAFLVRSKQTLPEFPNEPDAHGFLADALVDNRLFDEAEDCLAAACKLFPGNADLLRRWATTLAQQSKWDAALTVLDALTPDEHTARDRAKTLIAAGRWTAAEARLNEAIGLFPASPMLHLLRLDVLIGSGQMAPAAGLWREIERRFPETVSGALYERRTRMLGLGHDPGEQRMIRPADLMMQCESLGGWGLGCEFGLVQRAMGAEPLGLLRWADIDTDGLIDALETAFEGVGHPGQTELETAGGALDEYVSLDRRFGMRIHTYVPAGQVAPERMLAQTCRRLGFLKQKLLDDLRRGEKLFVYKNARRTLTETELERLRRAIRRHGDNSLLYVRYQTQEHRFPSVLSPAPGLLVGSIDTMGMTPDGMPMPIPFNSWAALVSNAHALWRQAG